MLRPFNVHRDGKRRLALLGNDGLPKPVFSNAAGTVAASNELAFDQSGNARVYFAGEASLVDPTTGSVVRDGVFLSADTICPITYDNARGNGESDDIIPVRAALAQAVAQANVYAGEGSGLVLDLGGRIWGLSEPLAIAGLEGLTIQNGGFKAVGGSWNGDLALIVINSGAVTTQLRNLTLDGNKRAQLVQVNATGCLIDSVEGFHFVTRGLSLLAGSNKITGYTRITEWRTGDPEFAINASYQASAIYINDNDCTISGPVEARWSGKCLHLGPGAITLTVSGGFHPYNGGSGVVIRDRPIIVYAERGSSAVFTGCYFDNGEIQLYSPSVSFVGCRALYNATRCTLNYWIGLFCNGQETPYQFVSDNWSTSSTSLRDNSIPFIDFFDGTDGTGSPVSWGFDKSKLLDLVGVKAADEAVSHVRLANDKGYSRTYHGLGSGRYSGAGLGFSSGSTPQTIIDADDRPGIREYNGRVFLYRHSLPPDIRTGDGDIFLGVSVSGTAVIAADNTTTKTFYLPQDAQPGDHGIIRRGKDSTALVKVQTRSDAYPGSVFYEEDNNSGKCQFTKPGQGVFWECESNVDGESAVFHLERLTLTPTTQLDITSPRFGAVAGNTTNSVMLANTIAINAALAASEAGEGTVYVPIGEFSFVGSLEMGMVSSIIGEHQTLSKLIQSGAAYGPIIYHRPTAGKAGDGPKSSIKNLNLDYDGASIIKTNGTVTAGSPIVTVTSSAGMAAGYLFDAYGVPAGAYILTVDSPTQVTLNVNATLNNTGAVRNINDVYARESYTVAATAGATKVVTVASTANIKVGMRCDGAKLGETDDIGDVNQNAMVTAVGSGEITLDRIPSSTGAFTLRVWRENDGILVTDADQAPGGYDPSKDYEGPKCEGIIIGGCSGSGFRVRTKRTRTHIRYCRVTGAKRHGYYFTAAADSYVFRCGGGSCLENSVYFRSMATVRAAVEAFTPRYVDRAFAFRADGCPEMDLYDSDINGPVYIRKGGSATTFKWQLRGANYKFFNTNAYPDGTYPQSILIDGGHAEISCGGFRSDKASPYTRPDYLVNVQNGGTARVSCVSFPTDIAGDVETPYAIGLTSAPTLVSFSFFDETNGRQIDSTRSMYWGYNDPTTIPAGYAGSIYMRAPFLINDKLDVGSAFSLMGDAFVQKPLSNGGSDTVNSACSRLLLEKAGGGATTAWTQTLCAAPRPGQEFDLIASTAITALTVQANTGHTIHASASAPVASAVIAGYVLRLFFYSPTSTWYPR